MKFKRQKLLHLSEHVGSNGKKVPPLHKFKCFTGYQILLDTLQEEH
jgi:hypothetical protein